MLKKICFAFILCLTLLITFALITEMSLYFYFKQTKAIDLFAQINNHFLENWENNNHCSFNETVITHPTLGFVHRQNRYMSKDCKTDFINNIGMNSKDDLPLIKNPHEFRIMLLGGSVAHLLSIYSPKYKNEKNNYEKNPRPYLETYLNQHFISPNGYPFVVSTGAAGAWALPNQIIMTLMYSKRIDAIVSIDGYNEAFLYKQGARFERRYGALTYLAGQSQDSFAYKGLSFLRKFKHQIKRFHLDHSYTFYSLYRVAIGAYSSLFVSDSIIDEFTNGPVEKLKMPFEKRQVWVLEAYEDYIRKLHALSSVSHLYSAQFLQPTRLQYKELTAEEKNVHDEISLNEIKPIENLYLKLEKDKLPIRDLSKVFIDQKIQIYGDHIHYLIKDEHSLGSEIVLERIANDLKEMWNLRSKKR